MTVKALSRVQRFLARSSSRFRGGADGTATVEFVIVMPGLVLVSLATASISLYIATSSELQQLSADLTRQSLTYIDRGFTEEELCTALSRDRLDTLVPGLPFIEPERIKGIRCDLDDDTRTLMVALEYDLAGTLAHRLGRLVRLDIGTMTRQARMVT